MEAELLPLITHFGMAGLIGWMWLVERRAAGARESQLAAAHDRLMEQRTHLDTLFEVVRDNTRAITALESAQRALTHTLRTTAELPLPTGGEGAGGRGTSDPRR